MISADDFALLISKFESEKRRLWVSVISGGGNIKLWIKARYVGLDTDDTLRLISQDGAISQACLCGCEFEYCDERVTDARVPPQIREMLEREFEGKLVIFFPSGDRMVLTLLHDDTS